MIFKGSISRAGLEQHLATADAQASDEVPVTVETHPDHATINIGIGGEGDFGFVTGTLAKQT